MFKKVKVLLSSTSLVKSTLDSILFNQFVFFVSHYLVDIIVIYLLWNRNRILAYYKFHETKLKKLKEMTYKEPIKNQTHV